MTHSLQSLLLVDDDELMRRSMAFHLEKAGYHVQTAPAAEPALACARRERPDLVLMDINMPGMDGLQAMRAFQTEFATPVILVTARRREFDEVLGLELGANDYVTKPFDKDVLVARVRAALRNTSSAAAPPQKTLPIVAGDLTIDPSAHTVTLAGRRVELAPREFDLLAILAREAGNVVSNDELLDRVWGPGFEGQTQVLYVHVRWLREKIEQNPQAPCRLLTVRRVGYKLVTH